MRLPDSPGKTGRIVVSASGEALDIPVGLWAGLVRSQFWEYLNEVCGTPFSTYEEDVLDPAQAEAVRAALPSARQNVVFQDFVIHPWSHPDGVAVTTDEQCRFLDELAALLGHAIEAQSQVWVIL